MHLDSPNNAHAVQHPSTLWCTTVRQACPRCRKCRSTSCPSSLTRRMGRGRFGRLIHRRTRTGEQDRTERGGGAKRRETDTIQQARREYMRARYDHKSTHTFKQLTNSKTKTANDAQVYNAKKKHSLFIAVVVSCFVV